MLLGGTVSGAYQNSEEWEQLLIASRFKAVTAPFSCYTPKNEIRSYCDAARRQGAVIAEAGVWKNLMDPDPARAAENLRYAKDQLAMADEWDIPCCVNIAGTAGSAGWDAADKSNYTPETYDRIIRLLEDEWGFTEDTGLKHAKGEKARLLAKA